MNHCDVLTDPTLGKEYLEPILRDALWLSVLLFDLGVLDPLLENSRLCVNIQLVVIDAEAQDEVLVIVVAN
jgi:hypothetical protein